MSFLYLLLLALIQGATEFLPVSSSAHLILLPALLKVEDQGAFVDLAAHSGTLIALLWHFRTDFTAMARGGIALMLGERENREGRLALLLALASLPVILAGGVLLVTGLIDAVRDPHVIAWATIGFGLVLWMADRWGGQGLSDERGLSLGGAAAIGLAQMLALIPGTSRAGICITAARALGYDRGCAARLAMLLAAPTLLVATGVSLLTVLMGGAPGNGEVETGRILMETGFVALASAVTALLSIRWFLWFAARVSLTVFVLYRLALGAAILVWF
jgi:undecaprenyl-diphosphatase